MSVCLRKGTRVPLSRNPKQKAQESQARSGDCAVPPTEQVVWTQRTAEGLGQAMTVGLYMQTGMKRSKKEMRTRKGGGKIKTNNF